MIDNCKQLTWQTWLIFFNVFLAGMSFSSCVLFRHHSTDLTDELINELRNCEEVSVICYFHPTMIEFEKCSIEWWERLSLDESRGAASGYVSKKIVMSKIEALNFSDYARKYFPASRCEKTINSLGNPFVFSKTSVQIYLKGDNWVRHYTLVGDRLFQEKAQQQLQSDAASGAVSFLMSTESSKN